MNTWRQFVQDFYATERRLHPSKCHHSGGLERVAKIYKCLKKKDNNKKTIKHNSYGVIEKPSRFQGINPMSRLRKTRRSRSLSNSRRA